MSQLQLGLPTLKEQRSLLLSSVFFSLLPLISLQSASLSTSNSFITYHSRDSSVSGSRKFWSSSLVNASANSLPSCLMNPCQGRELSRLNVSTISVTSRVTGHLVHTPCQVASQEPSSPSYLNRLCAFAKPPTSTNSPSHSSRSALFYRDRASPPCPCIGYGG